MKAKKKRVIPGFGLSMGVTITILSLVVLIPLAALVIYTSRMHLSDIIETITRRYHSDAHRHLYDFCPLSCSA